MPKKQTGVRITALTEHYLNALSDSATQTDVINVGALLYYVLNNRLRGEETMDSVRFLTSLVDDLHGGEEKTVSFDDAQHIENVLGFLLDNALYGSLADEVREALPDYR